MSPSDGTDRPEREGHKLMCATLWTNFGWLAVMAAPFATALAFWHGIGAACELADRIGDRVAQRRADRARRAASAARLARLRRMLAA